MLLLLVKTDGNLGGLYGLLLLLRLTLDGDACCPHEGGCPPQSSRLPPSVVLVQSTSSSKHHIVNSAVVDVLQS